MLTVQPENCNTQPCCCDRARAVSSWGFMVLAIISSKDLWGVQTFPLHSPPPNSFRTLFLFPSQTEVPTVRPHPQHPCCPWWHKRRLTCNAQPRATKRMAWRTLLCKSWQSVAMSVHSWRNLTAVLQRSNRKGVKFIRSDCLMLQSSEYVHSYI